MKRLLLILILTFSFQTLSKADDIRDFQIEGISIGDSLLDYYSKSNIDKTKYTPWNNKETYYQFWSKKNITEYDAVTFAFLSNDKKYKINEVTGRKYMDYQKCKKKIVTISLEVSSMFNSATKDDRGEYSHRIDKSKKSLVRTVNYNLNDGSLVHIACYDWSNKLETEKGYKDSLIIAIASKEFVKWQETKAYK